MVPKSHHWAPMVKFFEILRGFDPQHKVVGLLNSERVHARRHCWLPPVGVLHSYVLHMCSTTHIAPKVIHSYVIHMCKMMSTFWYDDLHMWFICKKQIVGTPHVLAFI